MKRTNRTATFVLLVAPLLLSCGSCTSAAATEAVAAPTLAQPSVPNADAAKSTNDKTAPSDAGKIQSSKPDVDFGPYMAQLQKNIKKVWIPPKGAEKKRGKVIFKINTKGECSNIKISTSAADAVYDELMLAAIKGAFATPLPLPPGAPPIIDIEFTFDSNMLAKSGESSEAERAKDPFERYRDLLSEHRYSEAREFLLSANRVTSDPLTRLKATAALGYLCLRQERYAEAEIHFKNLLRTYPEALSMYVALAEIYDLQGRSDDALSILETGLKSGVEKDKELKQTSEEMITRLKRERADGGSISRAQALFKSGKTVEAFSMLDALKKLYPKEIPIEQAYAWMYLSSGDTTSARKHLAEARKLDPNEPTLIANEGVIFQREGKLLKARDCFKEALKNTDPTKKSYRYLESIVKAIAREENPNPAANDEHAPDYFPDATGGQLARWKTSEMPIRVFIEEGDGIPGYKDEYRDALRQAFKEWGLASKGAVSFNMVDKSDNAQIRCRFTDDPSLLESSIGVGSTKLAGGSAFIRKAMITILTQLPKDVMVNSNIQEVCLHEVGHALGIEHHSPNINDVMYFIALQPKTHLSNRDKATLAKLYSSETKTPDWALSHDEGRDFIEQSKFRFAIAPLAKALPFAPSNEKLIADLQHAYLGAVIENFKEGTMGDSEELIKKGLALKPQGNLEKLYLTFQSSIDMLKKLNGAERIQAFEEIQKRVKF